MAKNVTFTGDDGGTVRRVRLDDRWFPLGEEIPNVSDGNLERLRAIPGHHFTAVTTSTTKKEG